MKRTISLLLTTLLMAGLMMVSASSVFANTATDNNQANQMSDTATDSDGLMFTNTDVDTTGVVQYMVPMFDGANKASTWNVYFGLGFGCVVDTNDDGTRKTGGFTLVNQRDAVVFKTPDGFVVTQPAPPGFYWYPDGAIQFRMRCSDNTPAPPAVHLEPYGQVVGPCSTSRYWAELNNAWSNRETDFTVRYVNANGVDQRPRYTVPAHQYYRTPTFSVMPGTMMWIWNHTADERIVGSRYAPDLGWVGSCPARPAVGYSFE
jgi:hypothetical protein